MTDNSIGFNQKTVEELAALAQSRKQSIAAFFQEMATEQMTLNNGEAANLVTTQHSEDLQLLIETINQLPPDKKKIVDAYLLNLLLKIIHKDQPEEDWTTFLNRTYGSLANDPIERPAQLPYEERESLE